MGRLAADEVAAGRGGGVVEARCWQGRKKRDGRGGRKKTTEAKQNIRHLIRIDPKAKYFWRQK